MGMDVIGMNPTSREGEYFCRNIWGWRPLAEIVTTVAPESVGDDREKWFYNDGYGLNAAQSLQLAERLETALTDGSIDDCLDKLRARHPEDYRLVRFSITDFIAFLRASGGFQIW